MSDRVRATLFVPASYEDQTIELLDGKGRFYEREDREHLCGFTDYEADYGRFYEERALEEAGIPFDVNFSAYYDEWPAGIRSFRPGKEVIEVTEGAPNLNLTDLEEMSDGCTAEEFGTKIRELMDAEKAKIPQPLEEFNQ